jgi:hypothetical protein
MTPKKWKLLLLFGAGLALVIVVANVVVLVSTPGSVPARCATSPACPPLVEPIAVGKRWSSTELGHSFEYDDRFSVVAEDGRGVRLRLNLDELSDASRGGPAGSVSLGEVTVTAVPSSEQTPQQLLDQQRQELSQQVLGLREDNDSGTTILGPSIGHLDGFGGSYVGTLDSSQGPTGRAVVALVAAGNGKISAVVSYVVGGTTLAPNQTQRMREKADTILSTFRWPQ